MKKPNSEMFRIIRFAIAYPGWHSYTSGADVIKHIKRAARLGLLEHSSDTKQFRLPLPTENRV